MVRRPLISCTTNSTSAITSSTWMMPPATSKAKPSSQNKQSRTISVHNMVHPPSLLRASGVPLPHDADAILGTRRHGGMCRKVIGKEIDVDPHRDRISGRGEDVVSFPSVPQEITGSDPVAFFRIDGHPIDLH